VILCGGTSTRPQLLQLSGVGRPEDIKTHGIGRSWNCPRRAEPSGPILISFWPYKIHVTNRQFRIVLTGNIQSLKHIWQMRKTTATGNDCDTVAEGAGFYQRPIPLWTKPDVQLHFVISIVDDHARKLQLGLRFPANSARFIPFTAVTVFPCNR